MKHMKIQSHKDLQAWQYGYQLAKEVYILTKSFPSDERFGIISQLRRAAISVPSNIAEGYHRGSRNEYKQFCRIAYGSASEVETQLALAKDLGMAPNDAFQNVESTVLSTLKLLNSLCRSLG
ncbi:MAG: four helix bundle protein [Patescibacteria group bacterium]